MKKYLTWLLTVAWAMLIWRLTTTAQIIVTQDSWLQNIFMMIAHFSFFGIQAILFYLSLSNRKSQIYLPITLSSLYGAIIEFRQLSVPGRTADPMDWILDSLGAIVFLTLAKKFSNKFENWRI